MVNKQNDESVISQILSAPIPEFLYHYTNSRGVEGIITSKSIWVTKVQYLNDNSELKLAFDYFRTEIDSQKEGIEKTRTDEELDIMLESLSGIEKVNIGVTSFTAMGDQLSQWRGYCKIGNGYSLGFNGQKLSDAIGKTNGYRLVPCIYKEQEHRLIAKELINSTPVINVNKHPNFNKPPLGKLTFAELALFLALIIKSEGFKEEKEWRLTSPMKSIDNAKFRHGNYSLIPYWETKLDLENVLQKIIIGPTPEPELSHDAIRGLIIQNFLEFGKEVPLLENIQHSTVPFREI